MAPRQKEQQSAKNLRIPVEIERELEALCTYAEQISITTPNENLSVSHDQVVQSEISNFFLWFTKINFWKHNAEFDALKPLFNSVVYSRSMAIYSSNQMSTQAIKTLSRAADDFRLAYLAVTGKAQHPVIEKLKRILDKNMKTALNTILFKIIEDIFNHSYFISHMIDNEYKRTQVKSPSEMDALKEFYSVIFSSAKSCNLISWFLEHIGNNKFLEAALLSHCLNAFIHANISARCNSTPAVIHHFIKSMGSVTDIGINILTRNPSIDDLKRFYTSSSLLVKDMAEWIQSYDFKELTSKQLKLVITLLVFFNRYLLYKFTDLNGNKEKAKTSKVVSKNINLLSQLFINSLSLDEIGVDVAGSVYPALVALSDNFAYGVGRNFSNYLSLIFEKSFLVYRKKNSQELPGVMYWIMVWSGLINFCDKIKNQKALLYSKETIKNLSEIIETINISSAYWDESVEKRSAYFLIYTARIIDDYLSSITNNLFNIKSLKIEKINEMSRKDLEKHYAKLLTVNETHSLILIIIKFLSSRKNTFTSQDLFLDFCVKLIENIQSIKDESEKTIEQIQQRLKSFETNLNNVLKAKNELLYKEMIKETNRKIAFFKSLPSQKSLASTNKQHFFQSNQSEDCVDSSKLVAEAEENEKINSESVLLEKAAQCIEKEEWRSAFTIYKKFSKSGREIAQKALEFQIYSLRKILFKDFTHHVSQVNYLMRSTQVSTNKIKEVHREATVRLKDQYKQILMLFYQLDEYLMTDEHSKKSNSFRETDDYAKLSEIMKQLDDITKQLEKPDKNRTQNIGLHTVTVSDVAENLSQEPIATADQHRENLTTLSNTTIDNTVEAEANDISSLDSLLVSLMNWAAICELGKFNLADKVKNFLTKLNNTLDQNKSSSSKKLREFFYSYLVTEQLIKNYILLLKLGLFNVAFGFTDFPDMTPHQNKIIEAFSKLVNSMLELSRLEWDHELIMAHIAKVILINSFDLNRLLEDLTEWKSSERSPIVKIIQACALSSQAQTYLYALLVTDLLTQLEITPNLESIPSTVQTVREKILSHNHIVVSTMSITQKPYYFHAYGSTVANKILELNDLQGDLDCCTNFDASELGKILPIQKILNLTNLTVYYRVIGQSTSNYQGALIDRSVSFNVQHFSLSEELAQLDFTIHQVLLDLMLNKLIYMTPEAKASIHKKELKTIAPISNFINDPQKFIRLVISVGNYGLELNSADLSEFNLILEDFKSQSNLEKNEFLPCPFDAYRLQNFLFKLNVGKACKYFKSAEKLQLLGLLLPIPKNLLPLSSKTVQIISDVLHKMDVEYIKSHSDSKTDGFDRLAIIISVILYHAISNSPSCSEDLGKIKNVLPSYLPNQRLSQLVALKLDTLFLAKTARPFLIGYDQYSMFAQPVIAQPPEAPVMIQPAEEHPAVAATSSNNSSFT